MRLQYLPVSRLLTCCILALLLPPPLSISMLSALLVIPAFISDFLLRSLMLSPVIKVARSLATIFFLSIFASYAMASICICPLPSLLDT